MWRLFMSVVLVLVVSPTALAQDVIRGTDNENLRGTVTAISPTEVTLTKASGGEEVVAVDKIDRLEFDGEPPQLRDARRMFHGGNFANALRVLANVDGAGIERQEIKSDLEFYRLACNARLAMSEDEISKAGTQMRKFVQENSNSHHFFQANELLGDLLVAYKRYPAAQEAYQKLADSPFPEYKLRAGIAVGMALVAQGKHAEALAAFDTALALTGEASTPQAQALHQAGVLGKAECLAEMNQVDEAIKLIEGSISELSKDETELHAKAYIALGNCYRKRPDAKKEALLAYLRVDVLYDTNPQAHAEALYHLAILWNELGKPERAIDATNVLKERYGTSRWANQ